MDTIELKFLRTKHNRRYRDNLRFVEGKLPTNLIMKKRMLCLYPNITSLLFTAGVALFGLMDPTR